MRRLLVVSLVVACGGKSPPPSSPPPAHPAPLTIEEANPPPPAPPPHPEMVTPPPRPQPAAINPTLANDLAMLPVDSEMVVGVDVARIAQSALWKQLFAPMIAGKLGWFGEFSSTCGFDPFTTVTTVALGMKGLDGSGTAEGVVVVHGLPTAQLGACVPKLTSNLKKAKSKTKVTINKDTFTVVDERNAKATVGFLDGQTLLVVLGPNATEQAWGTAKLGGSALSSSPAFMDMLRSISASDSVVALINGQVLGKAKSAGVNMKAAFGSLDLTDSLTMDFRMRLNSADEAAQLTAMAKGQVSSAQVKQLFDRLDVTADGPDVRFQVAMSAAKLQALAGMVGGMMGGGMGNTP